MWYVVWTASRLEQRLADKIEREVSADIYKRCWIPRKTERRRIKGELTDVEIVLFPGYVFIDTEMPEAVYFALKPMKNFYRLLQTGEVFTPICPSEEQLIRRLTGEDGVVGVSVGIMKDGRVRIIDGSLAGLEKYIVAVDRHKRKAFLEMELFGEVRKFNVGLEVVGKGRTG